MVIPSPPLNPFNIFLGFRENFYQFQKSSKRYKNTEEDFQVRKALHGAAMIRYRDAEQEVQEIEKETNSHLHNQRMLLDSAKSTLENIHVANYGDRVRDPYSFREKFKNAFGRGNRDEVDRLKEAGEQIDWAVKSARSLSK